MRLGEPLGLPVVLGGDGEGVEEDEEQHSPVEGDGFHRPAAPPAQHPVQAAQTAPGGEDEVIWGGGFGGIEGIWGWLWVYGGGGG